MKSYVHCLGFFFAPIYSDIEGVRNPTRDNCVSASEAIPHVQARVAKENFLRAQYGISRRKVSYLAFFESHKQKKEKVSASCSSFLNEYSKAKQPHFAFEIYVDKLLTKQLLLIPFPLQQKLKIYRL